MIPILFPADAETYTTQGLGALSDAISCKVREERNGEYELEMKYPQAGLHFSEIADRCIILAIPSPWRAAQPFRIYRITKPLNGVCTIYARHITYDLSGIPVNVFSAQSAAGAMSGLKTNSATANPFEFWTDKQTAAAFAVSVPASIRSLLGGRTGSILDVYGGEYEWDGWTVRLHEHRGTDRGVTIRYGKNLTDIEQDRNIANVRTGLYPYWADNDGNLVVCDPPIVNAPGSYDFINIQTVDFSQEWQEAPTPAQLKARAEQYIQANGIGVPTVSISVSFVDLSRTDQYKDLALLEQCDLCDTLTVQFEALGIDATAEVVSIETDVLLERYDKIEVGSLRTNIADTIVDNQQRTDEQIKQTTSYLEDRIQQSTDLITNGGGYIYRKFDAAKNWVEIGSTDNLDLSKAIHVWRWNNGGFGHSGNGYNGPYRTAITQDGHIVADFIDAGTLTANIIRAGILQDMKGWNFWDLETGEFRLAATATVNGQQIATKPETISGVDVEYASGTSQTTPPTSGWSTTAPAWQDGRYIWQRTVTTLADGTKSISEPTCIQGGKGAQGPAGKDGAGVSQIVEQYYLSTSSTTQTGGSWSTAQPKWQKGRYIWTRSMVTWTDGTTTYTDPVLAQAINGANQSASDAQQSVNDLDNSLNSEGVFNRLTDNGKIQGIYMSGGQLYINGSYIKSGTLNANLIRAGILQDVEGKAFYLDLANGVLRMNATELSISGAPAASQSYAQQQAQAAQQAAIAAAAQSLSDYADTVTASLDDLQQQVDGQITTYFYDYKPANDNAPANEWTTVEEMRRHAGDLFYNTSNGDAYRWALNYGTWQWLEIVDTDVAAALAAAAAAQDTADSKRRVFTAQPVPPYDVGDLWAEENNGPLQVCVTSKASGGAFAAADWTDAANYTAQAAEAGRNLISNTQLLGVTSSNSWADVSDCTASYDTTDDSNYYIVRLPATDYALQNLRGKTVTLSYQVKIDREITYGIEHTPALFTLRVDIEFADGSSQSIHPDYEIHTDDVANIIATQPTNGWVTKTKTAEIQDKEIESVTLKYIFQYIAGAASFRYAKLEFGEIATPWSPAPEDTAIAAEAPALDQLGTFNKLTNNGQLQGIYMSGGQLYINGSYIRAGTIDASQVNVTNLNADNIKSGTITGRAISGGTITGTTITGSSVRSTSNSGSVLVYQGHVSLYDPSGNTLLDIVPGGNNNPANLRFYLPSFGNVGSISCQNDNGLGRIIVNCSNNGFFTTNRIQTQEIACSNGSGIYSNSYKFTPGNKNFGWVESDGGRVVSFDKVNLGTTGATWKVDWVWVADIGRYCLATVT